MPSSDSAHGTLPVMCGGTTRRVDSTRRLRHRRHAPISARVPSAVRDVREVTRRTLQVACAGPLRFLCVDAEEDEVTPLATQARARPRRHRALLACTGSTTTEESDHDHLAPQRGEAKPTRNGEQRQVEVGAWTILPWST